MPSKRYLITRTSVEGGASTYGKIREFTSKALSEGYSIVFNNRVQTALRLTRRMAEKPDPGHDVFEDLFLAMKDSQKTFTVEVYAPDSEVARTSGEGGLIAGVLGFKLGNLYVIEDVFYPHTRRDGHNYLEMAVYALLQRLFTAGIYFVDVTKIASLAKNYFRPQVLRSRYDVMSHLDQLSDTILSVDSNPFVQKEIDDTPKY